MPKTKPRERTDYVCDVYWWLREFRSMADRFGTSKDSLHVNVTRVLSTLLEIMPKEINGQKHCL